MKDSDETGDSSSTNETGFKRLECRIEEVSLGLTDSTPKFGDMASLITARVLELPLPERFRMSNIPVYDEKNDTGDHLDTFNLRCCCKEQVKK